MPRPRFTKKIEFQASSLMRGRIVKTCKYSPELVKIVDDSKVNLDAKDIEGWCNLSYTVKEIHKDNNTVTLQYKIPNAKFQCIDVTWPIKGLCKVSGIKI